VKEKKEERFAVALVQADLKWENVPVNLSRFDDRLADIRGADLIVLPEMFASGFTMEGKERVAFFYEAVVARMQAWSAARKALVVGSTAYETGGLFFNRLVAAFPDGSTRFYDKRHLFTMGGEDRHFAAGRELPLLCHKGVRIAPFICYDLRFPVWSRNASGYDVALYVANWPAGRREAWQVLLKARAIENQAYVAGVNRVGRDGHGTRHAGDSVLISPRGRVVGSVAPGADATCLVELDLAGSRAFRERFPVLRDRDEYHVEL
jgi:predicted amidohydrolase